MQLNLNKSVYSDNMYKTIYSTYILAKHIFTVIYLITFTDLWSDGFKPSKQIMVHGTTIPLYFVQVSYEKSYYETAWSSPYNEVLEERINNYNINVNSS
jgi:hypothetical protein